MRVLAYDVRLREIGKRYGETTVLDGIDLEVEHGEFIAVLGRSGTGKSTLLNLIGSLDEPTTGSIELLGHDLATLRESDRASLRAQRLGFVFQFFNLIPTLTARENIELPLALIGAKRAQARARALGLLADLNLASCADRFPDELSGGEQQRIAIARAVAHEPALVLADEPTGNLDLETSEHVLALLTALCRDRGTTLIVATHSTEVADACDRVITISGSIRDKRPV